MHWNLLENAPRSWETYCMAASRYGRGALLQDLDIAINRETGYVLYHRIMDCVVLAGDDAQLITSYAPRYKETTR